jgi:hypothetical protein
MIIIISDDIKPRLINLRERGFYYRDVVYEGIERIENLIELEDLRKQQLSNYLAVYKDLKKGLFLDKPSKNKIYVFELKNAHNGRIEVRYKTSLNGKMKSGYYNISRIDKKILSLFGFKLEMAEGVKGD